MFNQFPFDHWLIPAIAWTLLHSLWQIGMIGIIWGILRKCFFREFTELKYLSGLIAVASVFLISLSTLVHQVHYYAPAASEALSAVNLGQEGERLIPQNEINAPVSEEILPANNSIEPLSSPKHESAFWSDYLYPLILLLWVLGLTYKVAQFAGQYWWMNRVRHDGISTCPPQYLQLFKALKKRTGIQKSILFFESSKVLSPITFGHFKPIILFPVGMLSGFPPEQIEAIILHELAHIRRHDFLINMLQTWMEILFFYHPVIWWIVRDIRQSREELCDDLVLEWMGYSPILTNAEPATQGARLIYAEALVKVQQLLLFNKNKLAMQIQNPKDQLSQRVQRLLHPQYQRSRPSKHFNLSLLGLLIFLTIGSYAFTQHSDRTVSVSADKMNVLYKGIDNPITVAVAGIPSEDTYVESEQLELFDQGDGHYIARPKQVGEAIIQVRAKDNSKKAVRFRVKNIPDPIAKINGRIGGSISAGSFQKSKGLEAVLEGFEFDSTCKVIQYNLTHVPKQQDPVESINFGSLYNDNSTALVQKAAPGDLYYIDKVTCQCPGDKEERPINSLVFKIQ